MALTMWLTGVDDPILWGTVAFLLNYVPILGTAFGVLIFLHGASIGISNVLFVARKLHAIEKLISVKPERTS
jgi:predicted PurR-regulated permease PerM